MLGVSIGDGFEPEDEGDEGRGDEVLERPAVVFSDVLKKSSPRLVAAGRRVGSFGGVEDDLRILAACSMTKLRIPFIASDERGSTRASDSSRGGAQHRDIHRLSSK